MLGAQCVVSLRTKHSLSLITLKKKSVLLGSLNPLQGSGLNLLSPKYVRLHDDIGVVYKCSSTLSFIQPWMHLFAQSLWHQMVSDT